VVSGKDVVTVQPGSSIALPAPGGPTGLLRVIEMIGRVSVLANSRPGRTFTVETPYLVAAVKGTAFDVVVDSSGASVSVSEGSVEVSRGTAGGGERALLQPGQVASVRSGGGAIAVAASDPAPRQNDRVTSSIVGRGVPAGDDLATPDSGTKPGATPAGAANGVVGAAAGPLGDAAGAAGAAAGNAAGAAGGAAGAVGGAAGNAAGAAGGAAGAAGGAAGNAAGAAGGAAGGGVGGAVGAAGGAAGNAAGAAGGAVGSAGNAAGGAVNGIGGALGL
jgi:hypothetical protein